MAIASIGMKMNQFITKKEGIFAISLQPNNIIWSQQVYNKDKDDNKEYYKDDNKESKKRRNTGDNKQNKKKITKLSTFRVVQKVLVKYKSR